MLAWNKRFQEFQIWDYKNTKEIQKSNPLSKCFYPFNNFDDCNFVHYSIQLSMYKSLLQRTCSINIGKLYIVHFGYQDTSDNYDIYECIDFSPTCDWILDNIRNG